jgi:hypothetical protein
MKGCAGHSTGWLAVLVSVGHGPLRPL